MYHFQVEFSVDGKRTSQIISARSQFDVRGLIEAQYAGHRVMIHSIKRV